MLNDSLALSDILTGLPQQADFDAVLAALMATERGRRFLAEYAERNRHAEGDRPVGALGRVEAASPGGGLPQHPAGAAAALSEVAAALARIEAEMAAKPRPPDGFDGIERLRDIAFVLHERSIEASLCDALDAAVRDVAVVCTNFGSSAERAGRAAELLRSLKQRVSGMIALTAAEPDREQDLSSRPSSEASVRADNRPQRSGAVEPSAALPAFDLNGPIGPDEDPSGLFDSNGRVDVPALWDSDASDTTSLERAVAKPAVAQLAEAVPAGVSSDPLAAVRALSEEELIALFS